MGVDSCTVDVKLANEFILDGIPVTLIDTPGFDDTSKSDTEILKIIAAFLATTSVHTAIHHFSIFQTELPNLDRYEEGSKLDRNEEGYKLSGVIYIHRISDNRFGGVAGRNFGMFRELCGDEALGSVVLVTNMWGGVSHDIGEARERELAGNFFKLAIYKGAQMVRHHNTVQSAHDIIRRIVGNRPVVLQIQRELVDEHRDITDTAAGKAINRELNEQIKRYQAELEEVQAEIAQALGDKDGETGQELEEVRRRLQEQVKEVTKDSEGIAANYAAEKTRMEARVKEMEQEAKVKAMERDARMKEMEEARMKEMEEARMKEMEQEAKKARERAEAARNRPLAGPTREETNVHVAERAKLEQVKPQARSDGTGDAAPITIPIFKWVFELPTSPLHSEIFMNDFSEPPIARTRLVAPGPVNLTAKCRP